MHRKLKLTAALVTTACIAMLAPTACGGEETTPEQDAEAVAFPARDDFPAAAEGVAPESGTYVIQTGPDESHLFLQLFAANGSLGHDHVVRATGWDGQIAFDWADLSACTIEFTLPVSGLKNDTDAMRELAGFEDRLPESDQATIHEHMTAPDQLDVEQFSEITFRATSCAEADDRSDDGHVVVDVTGSFKIHGEQKEVVVPMELFASDGVVAARGRTMLQHSDFGFEPYSNGGGLFQNKPEFHVVIDVRGAAE